MSKCYTELLKLIWLLFSEKQTSSDFLSDRSELRGQIIKLTLDGPIWTVFLILKNFQRLSLNSTGSRKPRMTKSAILSVFLSRALAGTTNANSRLNEDCVDIILGKLCNEQCVGYLVDCVAKCDNDSVCIANCGREESNCVNSCPCNADCIDGCDGCEHPFCTQCDDIDLNEDFQKCEGLGSTNFHPECPALTILPWVDP